MQSRYADRKSESLSSSGVGSDEIVNLTSANQAGKTPGPVETTGVPGSSLAGENSCTDDVDSGNYNQWKKIEKSIWVSLDKISIYITRYIGQK